METYEISPDPYWTNFQFHQLLGREPSGRVEKIKKEEHKMKIEEEMWKCKECKIMMYPEEEQEEQDQELVWSETYDVAQRMRNHKYSQASLEMIKKPVILLLVMI